MAAVNPADSNPDKGENRNLQPDHNRSVFLDLIAAQIGDSTSSAVRMTSVSGILEPTQIVILLVKQCAQLLRHDADLQKDLKLIYPNINLDQYLEGLRGTLNFVSRNYPPEALAQFQLLRDSLPPGIAAVTSRAIARLVSVACNHKIGYLGYYTINNFLKTAAFQNAHQAHAAVRQLRSIISRLHPSEHSSIFRSLQIIYKERESATPEKIVSYLEKISTVLRSHPQPEQRKYFFEMLDKVVSQGWSPIDSMYLIEKLVQHKDPNCRAVGLEYFSEKPSYKGAIIPFMVVVLLREGGITESFRMAKELLQMELAGAGNLKQLSENLLSLIGLPEFDGRKITTDYVLQRARIFSGRGESPSEAVKDMCSSIYLARVEKPAQAAMQVILYDDEPGKLQSAIKEMTFGYGSDQHPLGTTDPRYPELVDQTYQVYRGINEAYSGFAALTHYTRYAGVREHWPLAQFGLDLGRQTEYVYAENPMGCPGRGVKLTGLDRACIFSQSSGWDRDPLAHYKEALPWLSEAFDRVQDSSFFFTQGCQIISNPNAVFEVNLGSRYEPYAYVVFNDHFHTYGKFRALAVPQIALDLIFADTLIPAEQFLAGRRSAPVDINSRDLTPEGLHRICHRLNMPILNLGWPSNFTGGLCQAFPVGYEPFFAQERNLSTRWVDLSGHVHKSMLGGRYRDKVIGSLADEFRVFEELHHNIYELVMGYQRQYQVLQLAFSLWNKGMTLDSGNRRNPLETPWTQSSPLIYRESDPDGHFIPKQFIPGDDSKAPHINPQSFRLLDLAFRINASIRRRNPNAPAEDFPELRLADTWSWSTRPESPFVLDTADMQLHVGNRIIRLAEQKREYQEAAWNAFVMPHLMDISKDCRPFDKLEKQK